MNGDKPDAGRIAGLFAGTDPRAGRLAVAKGRFAFDAQAVRIVILVFAGYYLGARLGFALTFSPHPVSVLWPPNSILLAALLLAPVRLWWLVLLSAFPAHLAAQLQSSVPFSMVLCWFVSNCFEALVGAGASRLLIRGPIQFDGLRNLSILFFCGALLGPFLSSFLDSAFVALNHFGTESYWRVWRMRFFSNVLASIMLVPVIVNTARIRFHAIESWRILEAAALYFGLTAVSVAIFWGVNPDPGTTTVLLYAPLPFLLWAAVRFGVGGVTAGILAVGLLAIVCAVHGHGPFSSKSAEANALSIQIFLVVVSATLLPLASVLKERKRAEEVLRESEERYREVVESQADLICRFLPDTTVTFVNEAYCRFFSKRREDILGRRFIDRVPEESREFVLKNLRSVNHERQSSTIEHEVLMPDGSTGWHAWTDYAVSFENGSVTEFQGIGRDITDRKRAEEARQSLAHSSRLAVVGELTAMIAHEVNQPLGAILSNADAAGLLIQSKNPHLNEIQDILADIRKDDLRASDAIRRIRTLLSKREMDLQPMDLNDAISDILQLATGDALRRRVHFQCEFAGATLMVKGDRVHMQQVMLNLIVNAMDAMSETPDGTRRLTVTTAVNGDVAEVSVADNGRGIAPQQLSRVFESFFTTKKEGMGLGLSIAQSIIRAHGGRIWAGNNPSGGAIFRFTLPRPK